jgi:hypothetical protein
MQLLIVRLSLLLTTSTRTRSITQVMSLIYSSRSLERAAKSSDDKGAGFANSIACRRKLYQVSVSAHIANKRDIHYRLVKYFRKLRLFYRAYVLAINVGLVSKSCRFWLLNLPVTKKIAGSLKLDTCTVSWELQILLNFRWVSMLLQNRYCIEGERPTELLKQGPNDAYSCRGTSSYSVCRFEWDSRMKFRWYLVKVYG